MIGARGVELAWSEHAGRECLRVLGWGAGELTELARLDPDELQRRLVVLPSELVSAVAELRDVQPLAGRFEFDNDALWFVPRFPFADGVSYSLIVRSARGDRDAVWTIDRPPTAGAPVTDVVAIYPTASAVPFNLLKLYVQFSNAMSEGGAARAVQIRNADTGALIEDTFLPAAHELWDPERRRLTLLLDPGRIKRGLLPHEQMGYPLAEGTPIVVTVDATFRDAGGRPLRAGSERRYEVGPALRRRVEPAQWRLARPRVGSRDRLLVEFDRALDHALLEHTLSVRDVAGAAVAGRAWIGEGERSWRFEPDAPWSAAVYALRVDARLEDLAGNSVTRVFDRDLTRLDDTPLDARVVHVEFECEAGPA